MRGMESQNTVQCELAWRVHLFACRVLFCRARTGRKKESLAGTMRKRVDRFKAGEWEEMWDKVPKRAGERLREVTDERAAAHAEGFNSARGAALQGRGIPRTGPSRPAHPINP